MEENRDSKLAIRLHIYDTDITVKVDRPEEIYFRQGANKINELLNAYFSVYKGIKNDREILYFAMIDLATQLQKSLDRNDTKPYEDLLQSLTSEIESVIKDK